MRRTSLLFIPLVLSLTACSDVGQAPLQPDEIDTASATRKGPKAVAPGTARLLVSGLHGGSGSTVGPGGALYVTEGLAGRISRVDPGTGTVSTYATGLPVSLIGIGGAMDIEFIGGTAYVLVTLVGSDLGGRDVVGIYRMDGPDSFTVIADIGAFTLANPTSTPFFVPTGAQYAIESFRGAFLVTDGHHNRVLHVTLDGEITEMLAVENVVPTGLAVSGNDIYFAQAGPIPHLPEEGRVMLFGAGDSGATQVASGARLLVDVEFGRGRALFALSQGVWNGEAEGSPAHANTGALVRVGGDGSLSVVAEPLDRPTSLEIIGHTAFVVTLGGEIWTVDEIAGAPFGASR